MRISAEWVLASFLAVVSGVAWIARRLVMRLGSPDSPLQTFYVQGFSRTLKEACFFFFAAAVFYALYASSPRLGDSIQTWIKRVGTYLRSCSLSQYALFLFATTAAFLFLLNAPGILYGTFLIDDYKMYSIATQHGLLQLFWWPINDHVIPLFWYELKALFLFAGPHPIFLNLPLFLPAVIATGGAALLLRMLGFGPSTLLVLLIAFGGTLVESHQLYGFYAIAPYTQVLALFVLSLICFVRAQQKQHLANSFQMLSFTFLGMSVFLESGGVWTPLAYLLFVYAYHVLQTTLWDIRPALRKYAGTLITAVGIALIYFVYLIALPHYTTETFYGFNRLPLSLHTVLELYNVLTAGVLLSLFAPRLGLLMSQPKLLGLITIWHIGMLFLFCSFALLVAYALRKGSLSTRVLVPYFTLLVLGTSLLIAIARPSSGAAAFYRDQNLVFPLFFLSLALAVFAHEWVRTASDRTKQWRIAAVALVLLCICGGQVIFSFYKQQYMDDIVFNQSLISRLENTITPALNELSAKAPLRVPSLSALFLRGDANEQLPELSSFSDFIGVRGVTWLPFSKGPYAASASPAFIDALKHDDRLRQWYLAGGEVQEKCTEGPFGTSNMRLPAGKPVQLAAALNPAHKHVLSFDLSAQDAPEKIFIDLIFNNDFHATGTRGHIRIDQYTKTARGTERRYVCSVDLDEMPAFALSRSVSSFTMTITSPGAYELHGWELH